MIRNTFIVPTNSGLRYVREQGLSRLQDLSWKLCREERGEAIPGLVAAEDSRPVFGITGEDLLENAGLESLLVERLGLAGTGPYEGTAFGLPTLCVISQGGLPPEEYVRRYGSEECVPDLDGKSVFVPKRYLDLIKRRTECDATWIPLKGGVDEAKAYNPCDIDYAIDIVLTGNTLHRLGLGLEGVVGKGSDGVIIGNETARCLWRRIMP